MSYVNVGALINGGNAASKKALKEALKSAPETVTFYGTAAVPGMAGYGARYQGDQIPAGITFSVVGPDPYRHRRWFGKVRVKADGSINAE